MQPNSEACEAEDRCFRVSIARRLMLLHPAAPDLRHLTDVPPTQRVRSVANRWTRNGTAALGVGTEEVPQWPDAWLM